MKKLTLSFIVHCIFFIVFQFILLYFFISMVHANSVSYGLIGNTLNKHVIFLYRFHIRQNMFKILVLVVHLSFYYKYICLKLAKTYSKKARIVMSDHYLTFESDKIALFYFLHSANYNAELIYFIVRCFFFALN